MKYPTGNIKVEFITVSDGWFIKKKVAVLMMEYSDIPETVYDTPKYLSNLKWQPIETEAQLMGEVGLVARTVIEEVAKEAAKQQSKWHRGMYDTGTGLIGYLESHVRLVSTCQEVKDYQGKRKHLLKIAAACLNAIYTTDAMDKDEI